VIICLKCGEEMGRLAKFCKNCGTKLPAPDVAVDPADSENWQHNLTGRGFGVCGTAGHWVQIMLTNSRFCPACGKDLEAID
jgi:predicted amidophosphoribosyltransferase